MKLTSYPHLVNEWHPTKNGDLTPNEFTHGSDKKVWWLCSKEHSYKATIKNKTLKNGHAEIIYEVIGIDENKLLSDLDAQNSVTDITLVSYGNNG